MSFFGRFSRKKKYNKIHPVEPHKSPAQNSPDQNSPERVDEEIQRQLEINGALLGHSRSRGGKSTKRTKRKKRAKRK